MRTVNKCMLSSRVSVCVCVYGGCVSVCECICIHMCVCVCGVNNARCAGQTVHKQTAQQTVEPKSMQRFCFACCCCFLLLPRSLPSVACQLHYSCFFSSSTAAAPRFAFKQKPLKTLYYRILELFKYFPPSLTPFSFSHPSKLPLFSPRVTRRLLQFYFLSLSCSHPTACAAVRQQQND